MPIIHSEFSISFVRGRDVRLSLNNSLLDYFFAGGRSDFQIRHTSKDLNLFAEMWYKQVSACFIRERPIETRINNPDPTSDYLSSVDAQEPFLFLHWSFLQTI